jgi:hypothetical protein
MSSLAPHGEIVMTPEVALRTPEPLAVTLVVPAATPVSVPVPDQVEPVATVTAGVTVATPGALLVRFTVTGAVAVWLLG